ncbi:hypothetical protein MIZ01_1759 [Sideroxyarcus emersonii]|uniref:Uncharacterized protein n=1 Tax=Sideroxyarcus emersonii TaxID=2764705 RepID=A0AAN1XB93_9PROT|nr:hypothetical protein MIZ01_1759 [Sideroxyarcus emersonii]
MPPITEFLRAPFAVCHSGAGCNAVFSINWTPACAGVTKLIDDYLER